MKKIILLCAAGMSTSLLVTKLRKAAEVQGYACEIAAYPMSEVEKAVWGADIVLLGPQIRFQLDKVKTTAKCPVEPIDMQAYGTMDGERILARAKEVIGG